MDEVFVLSEIDFEDRSGGGVGSGRDAGVWPKEHFDPDEVDQPDEFVELRGRFGNARDLRTRERVADSVMYHPDHWEEVGQPPPDRPLEFWYRTETDGAVALRAKTPDARGWLRANEEYNTVGKNSPHQKVTPRGSKFGAN